MRALMDVLFPPRCFGCGLFLLPRERHANCCAACAHTVHDVESPKCPICATPRDVHAGIDELCARCLERRPAFALTLARWVYDGAVRDAIRRSKASQDPASLFALIDSSIHWFREIEHMCPGASWTTPPPHPIDLRQRGWDPARAALRHAIGRNARVEDPLVKVRATTKQAHLGRDERLRSMHEAFDCATSVAGEWILFDDVMTTGATLGDAARALRRAGARTVICVVIARAL